MSQIQQLIERCVRYWFPQATILTNHRPPWLHGLEVDIYFPSCRVGLEVQGRQHYLWAPTMQATPQQFFEQRRRDGAKRSLAAQVGVRIFVVKHGLDGLYKKMRNIFPGHSFPRLPQDIVDDWNTYRRRSHQASQNGIAFKIRGNGELTPVNMASSEWLKLNQEMKRAASSVV